MSAANLDAIKKRYNFKQISIATWRDPTLSVHPARGGPKPLLISPDDAGKPFLPQYRVKYDAVPQPTDDEESEREDDVAKDVAKSANASATSLVSETHSDVDSVTSDARSISSPVRLDLTQDIIKDEDLVPSLQSVPTPTTSEDAVDAVKAPTESAEDAIEPPPGPDIIFQPAKSEETLELPRGRPLSASMDDLLAPPSPRDRDMPASTGSLENVEDSVTGAHEDVVDERRVAFAHGTPSPAPTSRKKKSSKRKKEKKRIITVPLDDLPGDFIAIIDDGLVSASTPPTAPPALEVHSEDAGPEEKLPETDASSAVGVAEIVVDGGLNEGSKDVMDVPIEHHSIEKALMGGSQHADNINDQADGKEEAIVIVDQELDLDDVSTPGGSKIESADTLDQVDTAPEHEALPVKVRKKKRKGAPVLDSLDFVDESTPTDSEPNNMAADDVLEKSQTSSVNGDGASDTEGETITRSQDSLCMSKDTKGAKYDGSELSEDGDSFIPREDGPKIDEHSIVPILGAAGDDHVVVEMSDRDGESGDDVHFEPSEAHTDSGVEFDEDAKAQQQEEDSDMDGDGGGPDEKDEISTIVPEAKAGDIGSEESASEDENAAENAATEAHLSETEDQSPEEETIENDVKEYAKAENGPVEAPHENEETVAGVAKAPAREEEVPDDTLDAASKAVQAIEPILVQIAGDHDKADLALPTEDDKVDVVVEAPVSKEVTNAGAEFAADAPEVVAEAASDGVGMEDAPAPEDKSDDAPAVDSEEAVDKAGPEPVPISSDFLMESTGSIIEDIAAEPMVTPDDTPQAPPSPNLSKTSSGGSSKRRADHWERKHAESAYSNTSKGRRSLEKQHGSKNGVRGREDQRRPRRYSTTTEEDEERRRRRKERKEREDAEALQKQRRREVEERERRAKKRLREAERLEERARRIREEAEAATRKHNEIKQSRRHRDEDRPRSSKDSKPPLTATDLAKGLGLTNGESVHGKRSSRRNEEVRSESSTMSRDKTNSRLEDESSRSQHRHRRYRTEEERPERSRRDSDHRPARPVVEQRKSSFLSSIFRRA